MRRKSIDLICCRGSLLARKLREKWQVGELDVWGCGERGGKLRGGVMRNTESGERGELQKLRQLVA